MGELVFFSSSCKPPEGQEESEGYGQPNLGVADVIYEFFDYKEPPRSGFSDADRREEVLIFAFSPIEGWTGNWERRRRVLKALPNTLQSVRLVEWAGRRYRVRRVLTVELVKTNRTGRGLTGWLCIELVVEELET